MKPSKLPSLDLLNYLFSYDPESGLIIRKSSNKIAGGIDPSSGYIRVRVDDKKYLAHRLAWKLTYGIDPLEEIDHINHNKLDNRLANLRTCNRSENCCNRKIFKGNKSKFKGVSFHNGINKFRAVIQKDKIQHIIGSFDTAEEASLAYQSFAKNIHKEFAYNHQKQVTESKGIR